MRRGRSLVVAGCVVVATTTTGCSLSAEHANLVNGKQLFVQRCGSCHTLARAGTKGTAGPDLDAAFAQSRRDGMKNSTFEGIIKDQILHPSRIGQEDPATGKSLPAMPGGIVTGEDAVDVAAYVGQAAGAPGKDTGRLASIGVAKAKGTATEKNGVVSIPADPTGQLAYQFASATAKAGKVQLDSKNASGTPHDISIEGNGVNQHGKVVQNGGTSTVNVTLKPGTYTFYCSVPGHRQAGMQGKLTVK
jgi:plastocyanin